MKTKNTLFIIGLFIIVLSFSCQKAEKIINPGVSNRPSMVMYLSQDSSTNSYSYRWEANLSLQASYNDTTGITSISGLRADMTLISLSIKDLKRDSFVIDSSAKFTASYTGNLTTNTLFSVGTSTPIFSAIEGNMVITDHDTVNNKVSGKFEFLGKNMFTLTGGNKFRRITNGEFKNIQIIK